MKLFRIFGSACLALTMMAAAKADNINFNSTVTASDATQLGRASRNSIPQDWAGTESYPGVINATLTYSYRTITFAASLFNGGPFLEIESYEPGKTNNLFLSAYAGSYDVNNRLTNWLGDAGTSGQFGDAFFQIILPTATDLVLVLNTTQPGNSQFGTVLNVNIDNYSDTNYAAPTPEPGSLLLVATGLVGVVTGVRRRMTAA